MNLSLLALENFRNIPAARLPFEGQRFFFRGLNGQGKSNLLEAIGLCGALRSFRVAESRALINKGSRRARLLYRFVQGDHRERELEVELNGGAKRVRIDGEPAEAVSALIGLFPAVTMHGGDLALLDGVPAVRRRFLDLHLSMLDREYLLDLKRYHQALAGRNRLLKTAPGSAAQLLAFETLMADSGSRLTRRRAEALQNLDRKLQRFYEAISPEPEAPLLQYAPRLENPEMDAFCQKLYADREKDVLLGTTRNGPHRDDFLLAIMGEQARHFASEGQKRGLVLALRLAQCAMIKECLQVNPLLVADDIIGELDAERRDRFWKCFDPEIQLFAAGTALPGELGGDWTLFEVQSGKFTLNKKWRQYA